MTPIQQHNHNLGQHKGHLQYNTCLNPWVWQRMTYYTYLHEQELMWRMVTLRTLGLPEQWVGSRSLLCCVNYKPTWMLHMEGLHLCLVIWIPENL